MRRDVFFYIEADIEQVYNAYLAAATNKPFERSCAEEPWHTISFGVNYSFKYNMNGGSCSIHLMPCGSGTAVNIHFSLAQAMGARYEKYAQELNRAMQAFLPINPSPANFDAEDFLKPENQVTPTTVRQPAAAPISAPAKAFCSNCGSPLNPNGRFCSQCGKKIEVPVQRVCPKCQTQAGSSAAYCSNCGTRL